MRGPALLALALALAGCEHMYGGLDGGRFAGSSLQEPGEAELVSIARAEAIRRSIPLKITRPPGVIDDGANWIVVLDPAPPGWKGGGTEVSIDKTSKRVLGLERTK